LRKKYNRIGRIYYDMNAIYLRFGGTYFCGAHSNADNCMMRKMMTDDDMMMNRII